MAVVLVGVLTGGGVGSSVVGEGSDRLATGPIRTVVLGRSVRGRPIQATALGDPRAARKVLVVGVIHGNETAGRAVVARSSPPVRRPASTSGSWTS